MAAHGCQLTFGHIYSQLVSVVITINIQYQGRQTVTSISFTAIRQD